MIHEVIVTTINKQKLVHIAPMGIKIFNEQKKKYVQISPFRPSQTLDNLLDTNIATINFTDNVKVFSGIVTKKKKDWETSPLHTDYVPHLEDTNTHMNVIVTNIEDDLIRPKIKCEVLREEIHKPFLGFNRAQFSVIELAVLSTRLGRISDDKVRNELEYLKIGIDKTAGNNEREAWSWIEKKINKYFKDND
jgi:hypothetical protein